MVAKTFFFYDLETSGFSPRGSRIMQFAGQRTDMDLKPVGEPVNILIKLTPDVLPEPDAVLITGITPQQTLAEGVTEAEFLNIFYKEVVRPGTVFVGFNSIRFDDEFMRFLHYRNFYDAYEWQWKDSCGRWDLLDVVRMTRALRPEGLEWPFAPDGKPSNRLEYLTKVNKLSHDNAHDALADVQATIDLARLIKSKQGELFDYLFQHCSKKSVAELVGKRAPFVYTTGRYSSQFLHTSVAVLLHKHENQDSALVYDLRFDPTPFLKMSLEELIEAWKFTKDPEAVRLPVKTLKFNRCPSIAPLGVINDQATQERIGLTIETAAKHFEILKADHKEFTAKLLQVVGHMDDARQKEQAALIDNELTVDGRLYEGFVGDADKRLMNQFRNGNPEEISNIATKFNDNRLKSLAPLYKARNFPASLTSEERVGWEEFVNRKLSSGDENSRMNKFFARLKELSDGKLTDRERFLLEELKLYAESII